MLVELALVKQLYQAVLELLADGAPVRDVGHRYGWHARRCMTGCGSTLAERAARIGRSEFAPVVVSASEGPAVEAWVVEMRRVHRADERLRDVTLLTIGFAGIEW